MLEKESDTAPVYYNRQPDGFTDEQHQVALLNTGVLHSAIFNSANSSSIATDAKGVIQIFDVGAERMLGYTAGEVMNKIDPSPDSSFQLNDRCPCVTGHWDLEGQRELPAKTC